MTARTTATPGERELFGPDLDILPTLADQIAALNRVKATGDVEEYVVTWIMISDQNGGGAFAMWGNDDHPEADAELKTYIACDTQEEARRERWQALHDHHETVEGFGIMMERELLRCGRFVDNRRAPLKEVKAVVRAFLATNGRLLLLPDGAARRQRCRVEASYDTFRFLGNGWTEIDGCAATAITRMLRRWRAQSSLERIIRTLGTPAPNGWTILGAKA
jgi:hypothetical protein